MNNKAVLLAAILALMLSLYLSVFRGCKEEPLRITATLRPAPRGTPTQRGVTPMYDAAFSFNKHYKLASFKVVEAADAATNKYPVALWHIVAGEKSVPVRSVIYGKPVRGMRPAIADLEPEALQPNIEYTVLIDTGKFQAQTNFIARERPVR